MNTQQHDWNPEINPVHFDHESYLDDLLNESQDGTSQDISRHGQLQFTAAEETKSGGTGTFKADA